MSRFFKHSILVFFSDIISILFRVVTGIIVANFLGPKGQGTYAIFGQIVAFFAIIGTLSLDISIIYNLGQRKFPEKAIIGNSFILCLLSSCLAVCIFWSTKRFLISTFLKDVPIKTLWLIPIAIELLIFYTVVSACLLGKNLIGAQVILKLTNSFLLFALIGGCVVYNQINVYYYLLSYTVTPGVIVCSIGIYFLWKYKLLPIPYTYSRQIIHDVFSYGLKGFLGTFLQYFNYRVDIFLLAYFLDAKSVGLYSVAVYIAEILWYIPQAISTVLLPKISSARDASRSQEFTAQVARITFSVLGILTLTLFWGCGIIIRIFFKNVYTASILPLRLLLPGVLFLGIWKILMNDLSGRGYIKYKSYSTIFSLVLTFVLNIVFIPLYGIAGAAFVSTFSYMLTTGLTLFWFCRITQVSVKDIFMLSSSDITLVRSMLVAMSKPKFE